MTAYLARRVLHALLVLLIVTLAAFLLIHLVPGDPVRITLGAHAPPAAVERVRHQLGLDRSLLSQFGSFLGGVVQGDFGTSINLQRPVSAVIGPRIGPSIFLLVYGTVISLLVAVPLGIFSALYRNRPADHGIRLVATVGLAMPSFWFGLLLVEVFSLHLGWLPVSGYGTGFLGHLESLTLPAITIGIYLAPMIIRTLRVEPHRDAVGRLHRPRRARAGFGETRVIVKHALRNALIATITILAINIGFLISGSVVIENVFGIPGLGSLLVSTIQTRDFPTISGADAPLRRRSSRSSTCSPTSRTPLVDPRVRL